MRDPDVLRGRSGQEVPGPSRGKCGQPAGCDLTTVYVINIFSGLLLGAGSFHVLSQ